MEMEKNNCPIIKVDGLIEKGKQFDIEVNLPEDNRNVVFGVIKDFCHEPVENAVVKLLEIDKRDKDERKPVSHTFTNKEGEFVFGPLCPEKSYEILFWANKVKHIKMCAEAKHEGKCLKGERLECPKCEKRPERPCEKECKEICR